jgi:glycerol-3-phosphate acyltransferase PlsY
VVTTLRGGDVDLRAAGSGNIGTTNVARLYGWRTAIGVLLMDVAKGLLPVLYAVALFPSAGLWWPTLVGATAFVGHCYPITLGFRGGKGVATGGGAMLAIAPQPTLIAAAAWLALLGLTGRGSVASLGATASLVLAILALEPAVLPAAVLLAAGVFATHTSNLRRLAQGEEAAVVQGVRWGRTAAHRPEQVAAMLEQGPAGTGPRPSLWRTP